MNSIILFFVFLLPLQWETNLDTAKKLAQENNKLILLNFSGSDWCVPCIGLRKDYFETSAFEAFAADHFILVNADFPRKAKNDDSEIQIKSSEALAEQYNPNGIFPLTLILSSNGKVLKKWEGKPKVTVEKWLEEMQIVCEANK